ncbi:hypothetical protein ACFL2H_08140 [Planctomycetota bacterium]
MDLFTIVSQDESTQLMAVLNRRILDDSVGPLSFQRIVKADHVQNVGGKTLLQVLTSNSSTSNILDALLNDGNILMQPCFPSVTRRTGVALFTGAKMSRSALFGRALRSINSHGRRHGFKEPSVVPPDRCVGWLKHGENGLN